MPQKPKQSLILLARMTQWKR